MIEERVLALAQHLNIDIFEHEGCHYVGDKEALSADYEHHSDTYDSFGEYLEDEAQLLEDEFEEDTHDDKCFECSGHGDYRVLTDDEADTTLNEYLESYVDDCVLSEIPEHLQFYFDSEAWIRDAKRDGCRSEWLGSYDGNEYEEKVNDTWYYIYRTN